MRSNRPDPPPLVEPGAPPSPHRAAAGLDGPLDENFHYGRAWQRYRHCYRRARALRILDAGCGTGRSTLEAARLNPGASVLGVDASTAAVQHARERAGAASLDRVAFLVHDLTGPAPEAWGPFDFIVCRDVLGHADDPAALLARLAQGLAPDGLLLATFPSRVGRQAARALRQAVDALAPAGAGLEQRSRLGLDLVQGLRPDHPIAAAALGSAPVPAGSYPACDVAPAPRPNAALPAFVLDALTDRHAWNLDEATALLDQAGLRFLYAATPWRWQPDRVFLPGTLPDPLRQHVDRLDPARLAALIDALDPSTFEAGYPIYGCPRAHIPAVPTWPQARGGDPEAFARLVPHPTGLAYPDRSLPSGAAAQGRTLYRTAAGHVVELDRTAVLRLAAADGRLSCGDIDAKLASHTRASDGAAARQESWDQLVEHGLVLLEPPPGGESTSQATFGTGLA